MNLQSAGSRLLSVQYHPHTKQMWEKRPPPSGLVEMVGLSLILPSNPPRIISRAQESGQRVNGLD